MHIHIHKYSVSVHVSLQSVVSVSALHRSHYEEERVQSRSQEPGGGQGYGGGELGSFLLPWAVAQRGVAAGDAHRVELSGAELLVARRSNETGS